MDVSSPEHKIQGMMMWLELHSIDSKFWNACNHADVKSKQAEMLSCGRDRVRSQREFTLMHQG